MDTNSWKETHLATCMHITDTCNTEHTQNMHPHKYSRNNCAHFP